MSRHDPLYDWTAEVTTQFPHLSKPQAAVLALGSFGIVLARSCTLPAVANILSPLIGRCYNTVRQRLREWYKAAPEKSGADRRAELDVTTCFAPLLAWIPQELAVPAGGLGAGCDQPRRPAHRLVFEFGLPRDGHPDRLEGPLGQPTSLLEARVAEVVTLVRRPSRSHLDGHRNDRSWPVCTVAVPGDRRLGLAPDDALHGRKTPAPRAGLGPNRSGNRPRVGCTWQGRGVAFPRKPERRLACTLLACWAEGHEDGWYILTDLPPQAATAAWYALRMWIEHGFEQFEIGGLAVAEDANHRARSRRSHVVGHRVGDLLGGCRRRAARPRRGAPRDRASSARHRRSPARPGKPRRESAGQRVLPRDRCDPGPADQRPAGPAREVVSRAVAWNRNYYSRVRA